ncbi:hypothetical protein F4810DRAFT_50367 [Camillea tinctor]|nr:hypothetical protein F4810DRAFT_50367 [Camillea tinctor]
MDHSFSRPCSVVSETLGDEFSDVSSMAKSFYWQGELANAESLYRRSLRILDKQPDSLEKFQMQRVISMHIAVIRLYRGKCKEAERGIRKVLALLQPLEIGRRHKRSDFEIDTARWLAISLFKGEKYQESAKKSRNPSRRKLLHRDRITKKHYRGNESAEGSCDGVRPPRRLYGARGSDRKCLYASKRLILIVQQTPQVFLLKRFMRFKWPMKSAIYWYLQAVVLSLPNWKQNGRHFHWLLPLSNSFRVSMIRP